MITKSVNANRHRHRCLLLTLITQGHGTTRPSLCAAAAKHMKEFTPGRPIVDLKMNGRNHLTDLQREGHITWEPGGKNLQVTTIGESYRTTKTGNLCITSL